ncbi:MAG TPA: GDP-mannose 4,6-dehydratase [Verrucomicrobiae bacterium]|jgi:UDP-glucose 4-epimerase|nr:GDP-mannose 4,6-dehydratase [Verrucomicrobiae bacterium]
MRGKRVLVTGGSGFIGSHLVNRLLSDGAKVGVLVRYGNLMKNERLQRSWNDIEIIEADLRNRGALSLAASFRPEVIFHLAAYNHVGQSFLQVEECFDVNAKGTANLLDICSDVEKFVYMSTSEVYGYQRQVPFVESMTPEPISPYAITKYAGELYSRLKQRMRNDGAIVIVRPFNTYGPYQSSKAIIPELIINALAGKTIRATKGEQTREFNYVSDIVEGLIRAAQVKGSIEGPVNLATGKEVSIRDLITTIVRLSGMATQVELGALPYRPTEIWRMYADASRALEHLQWSPRVTLEQGLRMTIDWFRGYLGSVRQSNC